MRTSSSHKLTRCAASDVPGAPGTAPGASGASPPTGRARRSSRTTRRGSRLNLEGRRGRARRRRRPRRDGWGSASDPSRRRGSVEHDSNVRPRARARGLCHPLSPGASPELPTSADGARQQASPTRGSSGGEVARGGSLVPRPARPRATPPGSTLPRSRARGDPRLLARGATAPRACVCGASVGGVNLGSNIRGGRRRFSSRKHFTLPALSIDCRFRVVDWQTVCSLRSTPSRDETR